ncbi:hypothetical protein GBA52_008305 [Prunus armeniaca]|nr:hypothetical protein GBA52_008305 [Prunus armeniaca]
MSRTWAPCVTFLALKFFHMIQDSTSLKYTLDLLHRNSMTECKPFSTPLAAKHHLTAHDGPLLNNPTEFHHLVGSI